MHSIFIITVFLTGEWSEKEKDERETKRNKNKKQNRKGDNYTGKEKKEDKQGGD